MKKRTVSLQFMRIAGIFICGATIQETPFFVSLVMTLAQKRKRDARGIKR